MIEISYGYKLPQTKDKGTIFWPALEFDIQRVATHNHNGSNSAKLTSTSVQTVTQALSAANWVALGNGNYKQEVTLPSSMRFDDYSIEFRTDDGQVLLLSAKRTDFVKFEVFINDPTVNLVVVYSS